MEDLLSRKRAEFTRQFYDGMKSGERPSFDLFSEIGALEQELNRLIGKTEDRQTKLKGP